MQWRKRGRIFDSGSFDLPWFRGNAMMPLAHLRADGRLRLFVTFCDDRNVGRIGWVDVDPADPSRILGHSARPVLDTGAPGSFTDNGILTAYLLRHGGRLYLYHSGYQACVNVPYMVFSGVAVSDDDGDSFTSLSPVPLLDRVAGEATVRSAPMVLEEGGRFHVWYTSDVSPGWFDADGKRKPRYDLKHLWADSPVDWPRTPGQPSLPLRGDDEHGIAKGTLWKEGGLYRLIYSLRSASRGYRLGYAQSRDGLVFERRDDEVGLDVSDQGWDSEMIAFPERYAFGGTTWLFYCGNRYGQGGVGYAQLME